MRYRVRRALSTGRSFRTLEVLELDQIELRQVDAPVVVAKLADVVLHCPFLLRVSLAKWTFPIQIE
jgi:hypothetical protein